MVVKIYRPGPLPWAKVPRIGYPWAFGMPWDGWNCVSVSIGVVDVAGHVTAVGGFRDPCNSDVIDLDEYHAEYAAQKAKRGKPHLTCGWCVLDERKHLIRTANRLN